MTLSGQQGGCVVETTQRLINLLLWLLQGGDMTVQDDTVAKFGENVSN